MLAGGLALPTPSLGKVLPARTRLALGSEGTPASPTSNLGKVLPARTRLALGARTLSQVSL